MKIAILTSGILPVPAVQGGAVENLVDFYLAYNEQHHLHDITVYSIANPATIDHPALLSSVNHYHYINLHGICAKIRKYLLHHRQNGKEYYHHDIEYFLHESLQHLRHQQYDIVILENRPGYAKRVQQVTNAKIIYHLHNDILNNQNIVGRTLFDAASRIITVSQYIKSCVETIAYDDDKVRVVHNGINLAAFSPNEYKKRTELGFNSDDFIIVFSGRMNKEKGILQLIEAMLLLQEHIAIKLIVIGSTFYGHDVNQNDFTHMLETKASPLKDRIVFTGFVSYHEMPSYLQMADIAVVPSVWDDPFPTTVLEAQAMGLPVITTRRGGIPEEVTPESAILLDTDDQFVQNLADAILDLYQHPEKRKQMSQSAVEHSKLFDKDVYARNFLEALE